MQGLVKNKEQVGLMLKKPKERLVNREELSFGQNTERWNLI